MNILHFHRDLMASYRSYIESFIDIRDHRIRDFVTGKLNEKTLWPDPLVQFNPTFQAGESLEVLTTGREFHPSLREIFRGYSLYRHQAEAMRIGAAGRGFVVTSGTGSGKSLTYISTIFNHVLNNLSDANGQVRAIIVYPMNALINSQSEELEKFKKGYEESTGRDFPITFGQFTGQEDDALRDEMRNNPPHILLTNYMMLELLMTRGGEDVGLRDNFLRHCRYLVFDELHTYRGRQGADVSMLIRRIRSAARHEITCIGTSATMVSGENMSLAEQRAEVARIAGQIFGSSFTADQVISEYLEKSLDNVPTDALALASAIRQGIPRSAGPVDFESNAAAAWIESQIAIEWREDRWVRRKPIRLPEIVSQLAVASGVDEGECEDYLSALLEWASRLNLDPNKPRGKSYLPYKIHQFIAQTGSVYATPGDHASRQFRLEAGRYADANTLIYPLVFSRYSGHDLYCVDLHPGANRLVPREFQDLADEEDMAAGITSGYVFINHADDTEDIWDDARDTDSLPEAWFNPPKKDGSRTMKSNVARRMPRKIWFDQQGNYAWENRLPYHGWFIPRPLMFDPTSGTLYEGSMKEWSKVMKLGGEGRSTATTVLSFDTIVKLEQAGQKGKERKILSFTDNRQDASLQAGHFNDFVRVGRLRSALVEALNTHGRLDYSTIDDRVFQCFRLAQEDYAKAPSNFPGPRAENEEAFKSLILYRVLHDLRRSWRVVMPNLEQCGLLRIRYRHLASSAEDHNLWAQNVLLGPMSSDQRVEFIQQVLDFVRRSFALSHSSLDSSAISQINKRIAEKLKSPWTLEEKEKLQEPNWVRVETLGNTARNLNTVSIGFQSALGRYLKNWYRELHGVPLSRVDYHDVAYALMNLLQEAGWLESRMARNESGQDVPIYRLRVEMVEWEPGNGEVMPDLVRMRSFRGIQAPRPNSYFREFYQTNFHAMDTIVGREHTGQIEVQRRKEREEQFKKGEIATLFCSPTMELGIDISQLSIVHMRNVPPSPANYAQRSGRAGRSGQAALVMTYCSNYSPHDRFYFRHSESMVSGSVTAPRMDLANEELLRSHLYAFFFSRFPLAALTGSIGDILDKDQLPDLPIKIEVSEAIRMGLSQRGDIIMAFNRVFDDAYFQQVFQLRRPHWFTEDWMERVLDDLPNAFDSSFDRWRNLYRKAINEFRSANEAIENRIFAAEHDRIRQEKARRSYAEREMAMLLNSESRSGSRSRNTQSEFTPFRYLAAEGFLPGYGFTRLPIRSAMESKDGASEYLARPRSVALSEFGPRNIIYHDGAKYRVDRMMLFDGRDSAIPARVSPSTGYILMGDEYSLPIDPINGADLNADMDRHTIPQMFPMTETRAHELERISCEEEERSRRGYDIRTYFKLDNGLAPMRLSRVNASGAHLLNIRAFPAARLVHVNYKWRGGDQNGFALDLSNGNWIAQSTEEQRGQSDDIRRVVLFTQNTANALFLEPVESLALSEDGVITLMYALKKAIEVHFQVESNEIGVALMGEGPQYNILIYEASEGSLGILELVASDPETYRAVVDAAYASCFVVNGTEVPDEELLPATYEDLLSYYNQIHHEVIDRRLIRNALTMLRNANLEVVTNAAFDNYAGHYAAMVAGRDPNSSTEARFLKYLYDRGLRLPDEAQPNIPNIFVRPDFLYEPMIAVFCDGTPHDQPDVIEDDRQKRAALREAGYQVLVWRYDQPLEEFVTARPDIFVKVKS